MKLQTDKYTIEAATGRVEEKTRFIYKEDKTQVYAESPKAVERLRTQFIHSKQEV